MSTMDTDGEAVEVDADATQVVPANGDGSVLEGAETGVVASGAAEAEAQAEPLEMCPKRRRTSSRRRGTSSRRPR